MEVFLERRRVVEVPRVRGLKCGDAVAKRKAVAAEPRVGELANVEPPRNRISGGG